MVNPHFDSLWPWQGQLPPQIPPGFRVGGDTADFGKPDVLLGLSNWRPPDSGQQPPQVGFRMKPGIALGEAAVGDVNPAYGTPRHPALAFTDSTVEPQPWWLTEAARANDAGAPRWPWLRSETGGSPGFRMMADDSIQEAGRPVFGSRSYATSAPLGAPAGTRSSEVDVAPGATGQVAAPSDMWRVATAGVLPAAAEASVIEGMAAAAGKGLADVAALAGRAAPSLAGAAVGAAAALPSLLIPTNSQSEYVDLGNGVRARLSPGQRTIDIERRVAGGLFGTGIGAKWERLPIEASLDVGKDGAPIWKVDHSQLQQAIAQAGRDDAASEMARRPGRRKDGDSRPPPGIGHNSGEPPIPKVGEAPGPAKSNAPGPGENKAPDPENRNVPDPGSNKAPGPGKGRDPSLWPHVVAETAKILRRGTLEQSVDEERVDTCRKVMKAAGAPAPSGQYTGPDGRETGIGVRLAPDEVAPVGGYNQSPSHQHLRDGMRGEHELVNRIREFNPKEKIIHFGLHAGAQGPDVMSISEKGEVTIWDAKWRNQERPIFPSRRTNRSDESLSGLPDYAENYIRKAVESGHLPKELAAKALANAKSGNFLLCTVGMGKAHQGAVELVKNGKRTGPL